MQYPVVCVYTGQWGTQTWATRNGQRRVHFRRPASDFLTSSSSVVTRRSAQWRPNPRRPFLAHLLAPLTSLMPVRTPRQLVLAPHAWHPGAMAVLLTCRAAGWGGWTTSDARAPPPASPAAPRSPRVASPSSMAAVASPWLVAADSLFVSGLTPPCRCIGTCSVVSHAGLTGRGLAAALAAAACVRCMWRMYVCWCADRHV